LYSIYAHLASINVTEGQKVDKNTVIGIMGNTPFHKQVPEGAVHLHFEVRTAQNHVRRDENNNYLGLSRTAEAYWANSRQEFQLNWVDLGPRYGYSPFFPLDWIK